MFREEFLRLNKKNHILIERIVVETTLVLILAAVKIFLSIKSKDYGETAI